MLRARMVAIPAALALAMAGDEPILTANGEHLTRNPKPEIVVGGDCDAPPAR